MAKYFNAVDEIERILVSGNFVDLVGALENDFFEAKGKLWDFDSERGKLDFAKDITSLANARGGIVIFGASTRKSPTHRRIEIQRIRPLPKARQPNEERFFNVLREWVYPVPTGVKSVWYADARDTERGIVGVHIPNQEEEQRPFLVAHYLSEAGNRVDAIVGVVQRLGPTTNPTPVQELHTFLREGRRMDLIHQKLDTIIAKMEGGSTAIQK
jgi:hypothetical protein